MSSPAFPEEFFLQLQNVALGCPSGGAFHAFRGNLRVCLRNQNDITQRCCMKRSLVCCTLVLLAGSLMAADSDDVINAAKKLADQSNYSWKTTVTVPEGTGGGFRPGPTEGKAEKGGYTRLAMTRGDMTTDAVLKGDKGAVNMEGSWQSLAELTSGDPGPGTFMARRLSTFKVPAAEAQDLVAKAKEIKKEGDVYSSTLTEEGAKSLLTFGGGRRGGGPPPAVTNPKGSVKFWVKDGKLVKYQYHVQGTVNFNGDDRDIDRTTTVEIKDVNTTKIVVADDVKKKLQ